MTVGQVFSVIAYANIIYGVGDKVFQVFVIDFGGQFKGTVPGYKVIVHSQYCLPGALGLDGAVQHDLAQAVDGYRVA
jgi:hypothetical protein